VAGPGCFCELKKAEGQGRPVATDPAPSLRFCRATESAGRDIAAPTRLRLNFFVRFELLVDLGSDLIIGLIPHWPSGPL
jgi:hypothetical protein